MKRKLTIILIIFLVNSSAFAHGGDSEDHFEAMPMNIESNKVIVRSLGIKTEKVVEKDVDEVIKTTGQIEPVLNNVFEINSPVQGIIRAIFVNLGDYVNQGESILQIESPEISRLSAEIQQYEAEAELAKSGFEREKYLFEQGISAKKEFEASRALMLSVEAKLIAAKNNLSILTGDEGLASGVFNLRSRKSGTITERNITIGQVVNVNQSLLKAVDLSTVWASADVYEKDQKSLALGQKAYVILDGDPEKTYEGKVTYLGSVINKDSRTLPVKITIQNPYAGTINKLSLKPGSYAQILIHTNKKKKTIVIPKTALTTTDVEEIDGKHYHTVFLKKADKYVPHEITVDSHDSNSAFVLSGLMSGDEVVTHGAYQLQFGKQKSEEDVEKKEISNPYDLKLLLLVLIGSFIGFLFGRRKKNDN